MKKIFTLFFALVVVSVTFAQHGHSNNFPGKNDNRGYNKHNRPVDYSIYQRDQLIEKINCAYDARIEAVKYSRGSWFSEKRRAIRRLEKERQHEINLVYMRFNPKKMHGRSYNERDDYARH